MTMTNIAQFTHYHTPAQATLADKAMLVRLKRSMFTPYASDDRATIQVEAANGVANAGKFNKALLKNSPLFKAAQQAYGAVYDYHFKHTLPWLDDGLRMLPSALYLEYAEGMRGLQAQAQQAVWNLGASWHNEVLADSYRLGNLFNAEDYPTDIESKYAVTLQFLPVPSTDDFRVAIDPADAASLDQAIKDAESGVATYIIGQLLEPLRAAASKLAVPIGEKGAIFRDSLIENLVEVTERLPRLNINNDSSIAIAINEVRALATKYASNIDVLREDAGSRDVAHAKVNELVKNFAGMF
jgi:hypothetical protein